MLSKIFVVACLLAVAHAGGLASYSTYTSPMSYGSVGATHETTLKGYGGNSVVSQYSKAVDTPYSSVRKFDSRVSNDAQAVAYGAAPAISYAAAPAYGAYAAGAYAAPAIGAYASPAYATRAYAAPAYGAYAAPAISAYGSYSSPAFGSYAPGAYAAPAYSAKAYGVPAYGAYAAPAIGAYASPVISKYSAAPAVAHLSFNGLGVSYGY